MLNPTVPVNNVFFHNTVGEKIGNQNETVRWCGRDVRRAGIRNWKTVKIGRNFEDVSFSLPGPDHGYTARDDDIYVCECAFVR